MAEFENGRLELLSDQNSALVLIDFQRTMFKSVASGDKSRIKLAAICAAKAAKILGVPVVLSAINPKSNGDFIPEITGLFPGQEVFARKVPGFDAFEDEGTWNAVKATGKRKLVVSGLWTSMCFTYSALHAIREGYDAYGLMDAAGDSTPRGAPVRRREDAAGRRHPHHSRVARIGVDARLGQSEGGRARCGGLLEVRRDDRGMDLTPNRAQSVVSSSAVSESAPGSLFSPRRPGYSHT